MARKKPRTDRTRIGATLRKRLFAHAWITNGRNGVQACLTAGFQGTPASLQVKASKLLKDAMVQALLQEKAERVENGMNADEVMERLTRIARLMDTQIDVFDFVTYLGPTGAPAPEEPEEPMVAEDLEDAKRQVRERGTGGNHVSAPGQPPPGFAIDLPKGQRLGKGIWVRELSHDAETGAPKLKLEATLAIISEARKALEVIARCKGMMRDTPLPPPKPDLTTAAALELMPIEVKRAWHAAYKKAIESARAAGEQKLIGGGTT